MTASDNRLRVRFLANRSRYSASRTSIISLAFLIQQAENSNSESLLQSFSGGTA